MSRTLLMSSERWKRRQLAGTRNFVEGISKALSLVERRIAIWRTAVSCTADVDATGGASSSIFAKSTVWSKRKSGATNSEA